MILSVAIMAHHSRRFTAATLRRTLEMQRYELEYYAVRPITLIVDEESRGSWFGSAKAAWEGAARGSHHHLVLQDDVVVCSDFLETAAYLVGLRPTDPISYYSPRKSSAEALAKGKHWVQVHRGFLGTCALSIPTHMIQPMLAWVAAREAGNKLFFGRSDDARIGAFFEATRTPIMVTAPSLVDHPADDASHVASTSLMKHGAKVFGRWRKANTYIGSERAMPLDWWAGLDDPHKQT